MNTHLGLAGEYRLVVNRPGGIKLDTGWFPNIILNQGLDRLGSGNPIIRYAQVGSGTTIPDAAQTGLTTWVAGADSGTSNNAETVVNEGSPTYAALHTWKYAFAQGAVIGNISEIGVGWATSGNTLFSRALILDGGGSPTTITLVAIDQLTVYYRIRVVPTLTDLTGTINISGTDYNYVVRMANVGSFANNSSLFGSSSDFTLTYSSGSPFIAYPATSTLGPVTGQPSGSSATGGSASTSSYTTGTYYRDTAFNFSISQGNAAGGIGAVRFIYSAFSIHFQMSFSPPIPKDNTKTFNIVMRYSWGRL